MGSSNEKTSCPLGINHARVRKRKDWAADPLTDRHCGRVGEPGVYVCVCLRSGLPNSSQKLLELIREKSEEMAQRQLSKDQGPTKELLKRVLRSQDSAFRIQERLRNSKMAHSSSCFGQKIDRIGAVSRLGCDGEHLPCRFPAKLHASRSPACRPQRPLGLLSDILAQPASTLPTVFKTKAVCQEVSHGYFITPSQVSTYLLQRCHRLPREQTA